MHSLRQCDLFRIITRTCIIWHSLLSFLSLVQAYQTTIPHGTYDECYHEIAEVGVSMELSYEVIEGGRFDIDVKILSPKNKVLKEAFGSEDGRFTIQSEEEGSYKFCFSNLRTSKDSKLVMFDIDRSDVRKNSAIDKLVLEEETIKIISMVDHLIVSMINARHDVRYLTARDRVHRKINKNTNFKIVLWTSLELVLSLVVTVGQVLYLKRFFEVRRKF